jgi:hypothetical protein
LIVAALVLGACGDDNGAAKDSEPPQTQPRVLGGQILAPGNLEVFCQTSRDLRVALRSQPVDVDRLDALLTAYIMSAPPQVQPQVANVASLFIFRTAKPTLGEDVQTIRRFRARRCAPEAP